MTISGYIDETVQQAQDFMDDTYLTSVGLKKPTKLVYEKAIKQFTNVSRRVYRKFPNEKPPELSLKEDGTMVISWHSENFENKYISNIFEVIEDGEIHLKIDETKTFEL